MGRHSVASKEWYPLFCKGSLNCSLREVLRNAISIFFLSTVFPDESVCYKKSAFYVLCFVLCENTGKLAVWIFYSVTIFAAKSPPLCLKTFAVMVVSTTDYIYHIQKELICILLHSSHLLFTSQMGVEIELLDWKFRHSLWLSMCNSTHCCLVQVS